LLTFKQSSSNVFSVALLVALTVGASSAPLAWTYTTGNYLWAVAVSRDGRYAIAGSDDMHAYFFNTKSVDGQPLWSHATRGYVRDVAVSRNGTRAAASDADGNIFFFDRPDLSGKLLWSYRSEYPIEALAMSEQGDYLVAGDRAGSLRFFKTSLTKPLVAESMIPGGVLTVSLSKSNAVAATSASGGLYFFSEASSEGYAWSFQEYTTFPCLAMSGDASRVIVGGSDGYVHLVDSSGQPMDQQSLGGAVSALVVSNNARLLVAGSVNGRVSLYRIANRLEKLSSVETQSAVASIAMSGSGERVSVATMDGAISMLDQSLTRQIWTFNAGAIVHLISMSDDGAVTAAGSDTGSVYMFNEENASKNTETGLYYILVPAVFIVVVIAVVIWSRRNKSNGRN
jgi:WD40 repeat protein